VALARQTQVSLQSSAASQQWKRIGINTVKVSETWLRQPTWNGGGGGGGGCCWSSCMMYRTAQSGNVQCVAHKTVCIIKHLSNHTNQIPNIYLLHIFTMFLLHVRLYHTPSPAELTCPLLKTTCCYTAVIYGYYGSCVMKYTRYNLLF